MKVVLIDGLNLAWRMQYAHMSLTNSKKTPTGVLYGVLKTILDLKKKLDGPHKLIWCWEGGLGEGGAPIRPWRKEVFKGYKSNRKASPERESVMKQVDKLMKILPKLGYAQFYIPGLEADDLIGVAARTLVSDDDIEHVYILTNDRDMFQCIEHKVTVIRPEVPKLVEYTPKKVEREFGVTVEQWASFKAIVGDSSDCYKGMPGVGPAGAAILLRSGFDPSLKSWEDQPFRVKDKFKKYESKWEEAKLCYLLAYIPKSVTFKEFSKDTRQTLKEQLRRLHEVLRSKIVIPDGGLERWERFCGFYEFFTFLERRREFFANYQKRP